jgi:glycosyltransferase involved in cell wall biosynthesis
LIGWSVSSFTGWGVYGLNLALQWSKDRELAPASTHPLLPGRINLDVVRQIALRPFLAETNAVLANLASRQGGSAEMDAPLLMPQNEDFVPAKAAGELAMSGRPTIGVAFFEQTQLAPDAVVRAAALPLIVTGSTWNEQLLKAHGLTNVRTVLQGIDPSIFRPTPRMGWLADRFLVFSGGKLELRKGQDLVMAAFRRFAERRPDALLVTAWHSPWPDFARTVDQTGRAAPVVFNPQGGLDVGGWARANGLPAEQVIDIGPVPNAMMGQLLTEMDAAVFPNRAEGGTNLVAMECMACGVPTILSANTGHLDLIEGEENCYPLLQQDQVAGGGAPVGDVPGWGESQVDEIVEALERIYLDREEARRRGARGAATLSALTWAKTAEQMKALALGMDA